VSEWVSEWVLFNPNFSAISWREQVSFQWDDDEVHFVQDQHAELDFYSVSSVKQQSAGRHVVPLGHNSLFWFRADQSLLFLLNAACLAENVQIPILKSLVWPDRGSNPRYTALEASTLIIMPPMRLITNIHLVFNI
jgi:hypothetical protein